MHLVNGTGNSPSPGQPTPGVVKQDKSSGGSVDTTKTRSDPQSVGMCSGERPIGAANGTQSNTEALCQTPPSFSLPVAVYHAASARQQKNRILHGAWAQLCGPYGINYSFFHCRYPHTIS
jgi:hypothetical protein